MSDYDYDDRGTGFVARPLVICAGAVIALCVAFLLGYHAHRGRAAAHDRVESSTVPRAAAPGTTAATSPSTAPATRPGALSRNSAGVITGYSHDQPGAIAAAGNYTAAMYVQTNRTHARELAVLNSIATTGADAARMAGDFSSEDSALAKLLDMPSLQSPGVIAYGHPLGYRVETVTGTAATIDVYVAGGQGVADAPTDSGAAGRTFYEVDQVQLAWRAAGSSTASDGDWRMTNWSHLVQDNGPELATLAAEGYQPFPIGETDPGSGT